MRVNAYVAHSGTIQITVASQRVEQVAATKFAAAWIHEEYAANVRALLREWKHVGASSLIYPAAKRLATYLPTHNGEQIYGIRELMPAGTTRDIDDPWQLEITRIRYAFVLHILPAGFIADETIVEGVERNVEYAINRLFVSNGLPAVYIPGDQDLRLGEGTEVDISCEMGSADARTVVEVPQP
jgi:hypothetical protein